MPRVRRAVRAKVPYRKPTTPKRPKRLKQWTDVSMVGAMKALKCGSMGVNRAAAEFGVLRTTLKDRLAGRVVHGTNPGPIPYISADEEKQLVEFLVSSSKMGFGKTRGEVLLIVREMAARKGLALEKITDGWWSCFRKRWPELSL